MKILVMGVAGMVGSIIRPALAREHDLVLFDMRPIPDARPQDIQGDVNDDHAVRQAMHDVEAVVYLAMGIKPGTFKDCGDIDAAFNVNVRGWYRVLHHGLAHGVRRFVYTSTLSVYSHLSRREPIDESVPADEWTPYGLSKRLGESIAQAATQRYPDATVICLRMCLPQTDQQWLALAGQTPRQRFWAQAPSDLRRLFLAALQCSRPGTHVVQTTGDIDNEHFPGTRAAELLGWRPEER